MSNTSSLCREAAALGLVPRQSTHSDHPAHAVQFYAEDSFLLDELSRFVGAALVAGDAVIVIATRVHRDGLAERLQLRGLNAALTSAEGRYVSLDASETLAKIMLDGRPDAARFNHVIGSVISQATVTINAENPRVSAFSEMVALLWTEGKTEAAVRLEELWNDPAYPCSLSLLCAYPISGFDREAHSGSFLRICKAHSHVMPVESYTALTSEEQRNCSIFLLQHFLLQQRAQALETEMEQRKLVEEKLRRTQEDLESLVEQRTHALRRLSSRLLSLQDSERRSIARELHDCLGQALVGLKLNVDMLRQSPGCQECEELWSQSEDLLQECIAEVRTLSYLLHPPTMDAAGFASAARWYAEGFGQRSGIQVTMDVPKDLGRLPDSIELGLFRVLQETLTNVHRHSGASAASIWLLADAEQVVLEVKDNGSGMPSELLSRFRATGVGMGVGLAGISERLWELGGKMDLTSDTSGTVVRVTIPLPLFVAEHSFNSPTAGLS